jgi:hypothetical protein
MPPWQPVRVVREAPSVRDGQAVLLPGGHRFRYPELDGALRDVLGRELGPAGPGEQGG